MDELKPCPFCGGLAGISYCEEIDTYSAYCGVCLVVTDEYATEEDAVNAWNRRATDVQM